MPKIESAKDLPEYGCVMLDCDVDLSQYHNIIDAADVDDDGSGSYTGLINEPHITLLYGVCDDIPCKQVADILAPFTFKDITLNKMIVFEHNDGDVLVFEANAPELGDINKALQEQLPYYTTYEDYKPHLTVAYLTKGSGNKYLKIFDGLSDICYPTKVKYNTITDVDEYIEITKEEPLEEEVIYSLASGMTIAPQQCTDWEQITSTLQGKQDWYNNGASDELEQFQSQLRKYGDNTTTAFDGTVPLNKSNSQYNTMVMEDEEVTESVATTSSNIGNPAPAVLSNNDAHQAEQKNRIGAQLKNFNSTTTIIKDTLTEEASNYTVSIQQKNNGCVIMVKYLDKKCEITPDEVDATSEDKLDYISNRLFDCFAVVVEDDDMKLIPDVANFINDKIHEVIQGGLDESFKRGKNMARKPTHLSEADGDEQANNMLSNPDVVAIINEIYAHRSDYGEDYEYLTPDEVAGVASGLGINNPSYNVVTVIATSIDDLIEELALNATPELLDIGASVQEPVIDEPTESEASLTNKGVEIKQESMQGRAKRRVVEARAFDDVIFEVNIKFYSDGYQRDTLEGTYKEVDESLQWFEEMWEDVTILTVYAFVDGNKVKVHLNDNFTNTKLMKYLLSGSDEDFMVLYNDWVKQGKPSTPPTKLSMSEAAPIRNQATEFLSDNGAILSRFHAKRKSKDKEFYDFGGSYRVVLTPSNLELLERGKLIYQTSNKEAIKAFKDIIPKLKIADNQQDIDANKAVIMEVLLDMQYGDNAPKSSMSEASPIQNQATEFLSDNGAILSRFHGKRKSKDKEFYDFGGSYRVVLTPSNLELLERGKLIYQTSNKEAIKAFKDIIPKLKIADNQQDIDANKAVIMEVLLDMQYGDNAPKSSMSEAAKKNKTVEGWAKELGKPYAEIHKYWLKAEKAADDKLPEKHYYAEVNKIAQKMIGAKYGEFKKHAVKESMFSVAKQNGKLRIITESMDDLEFEIKLSVKGGAELLADLLAFAGMGDTLNVVDYLDDTLTVACDDEVYLYADAFADNIIDDLLAGEAVFDYVCNEQFTPNDAQMGFVVGESFDSVAKNIAHKEHIPEKNAAAILANSTRNASKAAHKANPKLNRVKG